MAQFNLTNATGRSVTSGSLVRLSENTPRSFLLCEPGCSVPVGVVTRNSDSGESIPVDSEGTFEVFLDSSGGCTPGQRLYTSPSEEGHVRADIDGTLVGWALEAKSANDRVPALLCIVPVTLDETSVTFFGARGNGVDDDTVAIQRAISATGSDGVVYFPTGTYRITAYLSLVDSGGSPLSRVTFRGDGPGSVLEADFANDGEASGASVFFGNGAVSDLEFRDFTIRPHSGGGYQRGFRFVNGVSRIHIRRINIEDPGWNGTHAAMAAGIWFDASSTDCCIEDCRITGVASSTSPQFGCGIMFYTGGGTSHYRVAIRRNVVTGRSGHLPAGGIWVFNGFDTIIEENTIQDIGHVAASPDNNGYGILAYSFSSPPDGGRAQIIGNNLDTIDGTGIYVQNTPRSRIIRNLLTDTCKVQDSGSLLAGGICVNMPPAVISDNIIIDVGVGSMAANPPSGIQIQTELAAGSWPTEITEGIRVANNFIQNAPFLGIRLRGTVIGSEIIGNTCKDTKGGIGNLSIAELPSGCVISNNTIIRQGAVTDSQGGITLWNPTNCTFVGNVISRAAGQGIVFSGGLHCSVIGNVVRDSGQLAANTYDGIDLGNSTYMTVSGNTSWGKQQRYGINGSGVYLTVTGNAFGGDSGGINFAGPPANLINEHNQDVNIV
jgi:parallel beta-helix repeat protein